MICEIIGILSFKSLLRAELFTRKCFALSLKVYFMSNIVIPHHPPDLVGQFPARFFGFQNPGLGFQAQDPLLEVEPVGGVCLHDNGAVVACLDDLFLKEFPLQHIFGL